MTKEKLNNGYYAAIDIGSNAVRLLIKRIAIGKDGLTLTKEQLIRVPLRLGLDVFTQSSLSKRKVKKLTLLLRSFADLMDIYDVLDYKACATSALRDAENGKSVIALIRKKTGIKIHILSGKEEARLIYATHAESMPRRRGNFLYVDVGGGSTEVSLIVQSVLVFSNSYDIGTIRVLSDTVDPAEWERMEGDLAALSAQYGDIDLLGTGGNINKLYRLVEERDREQQRITVASLRRLHGQLSHLSPEQRVGLFRLKYDRAEVIVPASHVFLTVAQLVHATYIYVPTVGLVDGIVDGLVFKKMERLRKESLRSAEETDGEGADSCVAADSLADGEEIPLCESAVKVPAAPVTCPAHIGEDNRGGEAPGAPEETGTGRS